MITNALKELVLQSFDSNELEKLKIQTDLKFELNEFSPYHGSVDLFLEYEDQKLFIMIPFKSEAMDVFDGYY